MKQYEVDLLVKKIAQETKDTQLSRNIKHQSTMFFKIKNRWLTFNHRFFRWNQ